MIQANRYERRILKYNPQRLSKQYSSMSMDQYHGMLGACEAAFAGMDYGCYMDRGDAVGYDDVAGFDYGYDEALAGVWDWMKTAGSTMLNVTKSVGSAAWSGVKYVGTNLYAGGKFAVGIAAKIPKIATKAWNWSKTARITYPVRLVLSAGKTVGKWVWSGVKWLFQDNSGKTVSAPAGARVPAAPSAGETGTSIVQELLTPQQSGATVVNNYVGQQPAQQYPQEVYTQPPESILTPPGQTYYPGGTDGSGMVSAGSVPIYDPSGNAVDAYGNPLPAAAPADKNSIWYYIAAAVGIGAMII